MLTSHSQPSFGPGMRSQPSFDPGPWGSGWGQVPSRGSVMVLSVMAKRKTSLLPDLEQLLEAKKRRKHTVKEFASLCESLSELDLPACFSSNRGSLNLDENGCAAWLIIKYGFKRCLAITTLQQQLPESLTRKQKLKYISQLSGSDAECVEEVLSFADIACPSMLHTTSSHRTNGPLVLAPPVSQCYDCDQRLVSYHNCSVRFFSTSGVKVLEKVTLRCIDCSLFYNYAQYGNKTRVSRVHYVYTAT